MHSCRPVIYAFVICVSIGTAFIAAKAINCEYRCPFLTSSHKALTSLLIALTSLLTALTLPSTALTLSQPSQRAGQAGHKECRRRPGRGMAQPRPRLNDQAGQGCAWTGLHGLDPPGPPGLACMAWAGLDRLILASYPGVIRLHGNKYSTKVATN